MVISIYEKEKLKRLNEKNIIIETIYYNPNNSKGDIFVRATDGKMNDTIKYKAIKEKKYFLNDECILVEKNFDSNFLYNIENYTDENELICCPNCGNKGKAIELVDGCPYCRTIFNFGMNDINNSKKQLVYKFHLKDNIKIFLGIQIAIMLLMLLMLCIIKTPIIFALAFSFIISLLISPFISITIIIIISLKNQKNNSYYGYEQDKNVIWKISRNEEIFYNNFKAELMIKLYEKKDLIDFEIIDYSNIDFLSEDELIITCKIKEIYYNSKIDTCENIYKIKTHHNDINNIKEDSGVVKCRGCGASIAITQKKCNYCERINDFNNEWIIESMEKISN